MGVSQKVLGQSAPAAATLTPLYTVPALTQATGSTINVANTSASPDSFRLSVAIAGAGDSIEQYLYYDIPINGNDTFQTTLGVTMDTTDEMRCYSVNGTCSFNLFGVETT